MESQQQSHTHRIYHKKKEESGLVNNKDFKYNGAWISHNKISVGEKEIEHKVITPNTANC